MIKRVQWKVENMSRNLSFDDKSHSIADPCFEKIIGQNDTQCFERSVWFDADENSILLETVDVWSKWLSSTGIFKMRVFVFSLEPL